jgi:hypothetical protein
MNSWTRQLVNAFDAEFVAVPSDSASRGLHDVQEAAGHDSILILGSRKTRGVRRTAPGNTAERLLHGAPGPVGLVPWDYEAASVGPIKRVAVAYIDTEDGRAALTAAAGMALELHAELQLVTVMPDTRVMPSLGEPSIYRDEERDSFAAALEEASRILPEGLTPSTRLLGGRWLTPWPICDRKTQMYWSAAPGVTVRRVGCSSAASPHGSSGMRDCR